MEGSGKRGWRAPIRCSVPIGAHYLGVEGDVSFRDGTLLVSIDLLYHRKCTYGLGFLEGFCGVVTGYAFAVGIYTSFILSF